MAYITFFQFLRRCFLWDAEHYAPPDTVAKNVGAMLNRGTRGADRADPAEQTGGPGDVGAGGPE